jgi:hypothetical protein
MLSDDVFKTQLRATVTGLEVWLVTLRSFVAIDVTGDEATWRVSVVPQVPEACPFELVLRMDQHFDMAIGAEIYEDQPIETLAAFQPLLSAIADGRVVTRLLSTAATATVVRVETIVSPADGSVWTRARSVASVRAFASGDLVRHDRHYAPYARGA